MTASHSNLRKRLASIERRLAEKARREKLTHCNCQSVTIFMGSSSEKFEAAMNLPCPGHGFRHLGEIIFVKFVGGDSDPPTPDDPRLRELLAQYQERLARHTLQELEGDSDEC
jgi:hypothetical protein